MITETKRILNELKVIKDELNYIKTNIPDKDIFLTSEEKKLLEESYKNEKKDKLTSGKDLRKQLDI